MPPHNYHAGGVYASNSPSRALLAPHPHRLYVIARFLTPHAPERGVRRPPCNGPPPSEHEV
eukprot:scaffold10034_cov112-Isochrysis_galbana.AAC.1